MTIEKIEEFITKYEWTFAKSMPTIPHWYVVRNKCDDSEFVQFVEYIRANGQPRKFWRATYIYLDVGEFTYWTMGNPIDETTIINRAYIK